MMRNSRKSRPILAEFSAKALRNNALKAKSLTPSDAFVFAVIKANAYGHGLMEVAHEISTFVDGFAILELSAAQKLRADGCLLPILMLEGFFDPNELIEFSELDLTTVVHRYDQVDALENFASKRPMNVFIKINTGMNRLGFKPEEAKLIYDRLALLPCVGKVSVMTHFADADNDRGTAWQLERLNKGWFEAFYKPSSFANSAALLSGPADKSVLGDISRPGLMLFGASPWGTKNSADKLGLEPVMTLKSEVIGIQSIGAGERVGYGGTYTAKLPMTIAIVACGYADGYPRHASNSAPILVNGIKTKVIGRVSMDMLCCDITDIPDVKIGSEVVLWGNGLSADEVAEAAGTISYELFCALASRVPRLWKHD